MFTSIRTKLLLSFFTTILVTTCVLCVVVGVASRESAIETFYASSLKEMRLIESAIDIFFDGARESIAVLSKAPAVRAADDSITSYAGTQTAGRGENSAKGRTELAMKELFSLLQGGHPEYAEIYMGTKWGGYASSSDSDIPSGFDPRVRPWYRQAMSAPGQVVLSPAYLSWTGSPVVACAMTVQNAEQETVGCVSIDVSLHSLTELIHNTPLGETGYVLLVQGDGTILANPKHAKMNMKKMSETGVPALAQLHAMKEGRAEVEMDGKAWYVQMSSLKGVDWKLIGVIEKDEVLRPFTSMLKNMLLAGLGATILMSVLTALLGTLLIRPVIAMTAAVREFNGDLTRRLPVSTRDEVGELGRWLNRFFEQLERMISELSTRTNSLKISSADLNSMATQLADNAASASTRTTHVAEGAERMNGNMNSVAAASEQASTNVNTVAASMEEMTATVRDIASNSETARDIAQKAVAEVNGTAERIDLLGNAVNEIGKVTEMITEISEQTNLLALNATIEAARAGEAGKGFAVVANEIKELARQTAQATGEIRSKIETIQTTTGDTVHEISQVAKVIGEVNEIVAVIAAAVEEQSATSFEIVTNLKQASQGIQEVNENVANTTLVTGAISADIGDVSRSVRQVHDVSVQVNAQAQDLSDLSERLERLTGQFKTSPPSFDLAKVRAAHMQWRTRLEAVINGHQEADPDSVASDHECAFGQWLFGPDGQQFTDSPHYPGLVEHHKRIHDYARQIMVCIRKNEQDRGVALLKEMEKTRMQFFEILDAFHAQSTWKESAD